MAGKSTVAAKLGKCLQREVIELDKIHRLSKEINCRTLTESDQKELAKKWTLSLAEELCDKGEPCIIEGGWIYPKDASLLETQKDFKAIFCGFNSCAIDDRITILKASEHWLAKKTEEYQREFLTRQVADSRENEKNCKKLGLSYSDFTTQEIGVNEVLSVFDCVTTTS